MSAQNVLILTQAATNYIRASLKQEGASYLRISVEKSGCSGLSYVLKAVEQSGEDDIKLNQDNLPILIDRNCLDILKGTTMDLTDKGYGQKQIVFHNPNVTEVCGCGESFSLKTES